MKTNCEIIKDLLPLYNDNVCSAESRVLIEEHISECPSCKEFLSIISDKMVIPVCKLDEAEPIKQMQAIWKKDKVKSFLKWIIITTLTCAVLAVCIYVLYFPNPATKDPYSIDLSNNGAKTYNEDGTLSNSELSDSLEQMMDTKRDTISPYELRDGEYRLGKLLLEGTDTHIFTFTTAEDYKTVRLWCDEYRNGELVSTSIKPKIGIDAPDREGLIAVIFEGASIKLNMTTSSSSSSSEFELESGQIPGEDGGFWHDSLDMIGTADIEDNKEIKLFVYASNADSSRIYPPDKYVENPEIISQYDYFCIVSCQFSI